MKLTKKFIKENAGMTLKETFPEVFESFTGWMICESNKYIAYFEKDNLKYGIMASGDWFENSNYKLSNCAVDRPATPQEIQDALEKEAVRRGFKEGIEYLSPSSRIDNICDGNFNFNNGDNCLYSNGIAVFNNGIWATIIQTITKQEAE